MSQNLSRGSDTPVLRSGGRLALADIVTEVQLPDGIICDATLWAACIGGAMQVNKYVAAIERAGLRVETVRRIGKINGLFCESGEYRNATEWSIR